MGAAAGAGAAAAAAIAEAVKASGVIVHVKQADLLAIVEQADAPLVVWAEGGVFSRSYQYLTSYKGLAFYTKTSEKLQLPPHAESVHAKKIWVPA
jgi:hypothetical protein